MSKCWYCNEELTTENNPEHIGICDKCYNKMFKYGNEFIRNMAKQQMKKVEEKCKVLEKELNDWKDGTIIVKWCEAEEKCKVLEKAQKEFAIEKLREIKNEIDNNAFDSTAEECKVVSHFKANTIIQKKIEELQND